MRTCALLFAVTVAAAAFGGAQAARSRSFWRPLLPLPPPPPPTPPAIAATCQAAHDADRRVSATFCTTHLVPRTRDTDVRTLAETAAAMGAEGAGYAWFVIDRTLKQRGDREPKVRGALERCTRLYDSAGAAFQLARKALAERRYSDVRRSLAGVDDLGRQCESEYAAAGSDTPSPLSYISGENAQLTYITVAITSLIK